MVPTGRSRRSAIGAKFVQNCNGGSGACVHTAAGHFRVGYPLCSNLSSFHESWRHCIFALPSFSDDFHTENIYSTSISWFVVYCNCNWACLILRFSQVRAALLYRQFSGRRGGSDLHTSLPDLIFANLAALLTVLAVLQ